MLRPGKCLAWMFQHPCLRLLNVPLLGEALAAGGVVGEAELVLSLLALQLQGLLLVPLLLQLLLGVGLWSEFVIS